MTERAAPPPSPAGRAWTGLLGWLFPEPQEEPWSKPCVTGPCSDHDHAGKSDPEVGG